MGLDDIVPDDVPDGNHYRQYPHHPAEDRLEEWADEAQEKFPEEVEYDFIEVSPEMVRTHGFAYYKPDGSKYIRIAERVVERYPVHYQRLVLIHEMTHIFFKQRNMEEYSDGSRLFNWVLGRVGADLNGVGPGTEEYDLMLEFLQHGDLIQEVK